jgi:multicomponent Na+:H+ antiporter subunit E
MVGFAVSYLVLWWLRPVGRATPYFSKLPQAISLLLFFLWEFLLSNLRVAWDVITPKSYARPGIIAVPLEAETDVQIAVLAILITLTPGSLSLDVSDDRRTLYVHVMFVDDPELVRDRIKSGFERRLLELFR